MKRVVTAICVVALLLCMTSAYAGSAGTASDPLISLDYVRNTYTPSVLNEGTDRNDAALDRVYNSAAAKLYNEKLAAFYDSTVKLSAGSSFVLTSGSAAVTVRGTVVNVSSGSEVTGSTAPAVGQRYIVCEDSTADFTLLAGSTCTVSGRAVTGGSIYSLSVKPLVTADPDRTVLTRQKILFNGDPISLEVYNVDGDNYFKLRDIAYLLSDTRFACSVDFNTALRTVWTLKGGSYVPNGDEMRTGVDNSSSCRASQWLLMVDGMYHGCSVYNIGGNNFFRLRDLGNALGFGVDYDAATNSAVITA